MRIGKFDVKHLVLAVIGLSGCRFPERREARNRRQFLAVQFHRLGGPAWAWTSSNSERGDGV